MTGLISTEPIKEIQDGLKQKVACFLISNAHWIRSKVINQWRLFSGK